MMKHFYKIVLLSFLGWISMQSAAQLAPVPYYIETIVHNGDYGEPGHDLSGYVTYKVYIQFANPDNYLTSIFAAETPFDCVQDPISTVHFEFTCNLFQHEFGDVYGFNEVCLYPGFIPTSQYDSFLTIGQICQSDATCDIIGSLGQCPTWQDDFEGPADNNYFDGGGFFWDESAIFAAPCFQPFPTSICHADGNSRVLVGQFTTCGDMSGCINIQYQDANGVDQVYNDLCFEATMPCLGNPLDTTPAIVTAGCAGQDAEVTLSDGGNGLVDYNLYNATTDALVTAYIDQATGLVISPIDPGNYYIAMQDEIGCRDTTPDFIITEPGALVFDATLLTDVLCFGETTGSILVDCSGGTGTIDVTVGNLHFNCGDVISNLGCGSYLVTATDDNGCEQSETIDVSCPAQLVYNPVVDVINCYGDNDGSITGSVTGGTGTITANWTYNTNPYDDFSGNSPLNITISPLDGGVYGVHIEDANGCSIDDTYDVTEPDEYIAVATVTDASCYNVCDGTVVYEISGGTPNYTTTGTLIGGNGSNANLNALCDGDYAITITDSHQCVLTDTITIAEPTDIVYTLNVIPVTCFGQCDGQIQITDVSGSFGNFTYELTPNTAPCSAPCSGDQAIYTDVCAGTYDVLISDETGCPKSIDNIVVETPAALQIVLIPQDITCYGYNNGEVLVDVIGGTAPVVITPSDSITPYTFTDLAPGLYSYTVTDANGCFVDGDVSVNEPPLLTATLVAVTDATCGGSCDGQLEYTPGGGTPPYEYNLLPTGVAGVANGQVNSLCALDYELVLSDLYNCTDTLSFTVNEPEPLTIDYIVDYPTCTGMFDGSALVNLGGGTGDLTLFIQPDAINYLLIDSVTYTLSDLGEGQVYFELEDETGCRLNDTLDVVPDIITDMVLSLFSTPETCWNEVDGTATVAVQNGNVPISYVWDDPDGQVTATASGLGPNQEFTVVVTDNIGCTLTGTVFVDATEGCFFISTAITPNGDGSNDTWILGGLEYYPQAKINVFNRWGQLVYNSKGYSANWDGTYQGALLPVADYYFTIDYADDKEVIMGTVTIKY